MVGAVKPRVVSGMRPTGKLHLGHLVGALQQWTRLQDDYDCLYFVADWHALTSEYADTGGLVQNAWDNAADWIAAGVDPDRSTLFIQSQVPEHAELYLLLQMVVPIPWLERVPTYKEQIDQLAEKDLSTLGFLGYPLLQGADVIVYKADFVPVGGGPGAAPRARPRGGAAVSRVFSASCSQSRRPCSRVFRGCPDSTTGR